MIKYLGSKRRLVPVLARIAELAGARTALDLFTGTTRVAQAFKQVGVAVTAVDSTRYADVFARCYIATDGGAVDRQELGRAIEHLNQVPGRAGYVTETFCRQARFFQPHNGERIDAVRAAISADFAGAPLEPVLLTSLIEAADRVDSTTGVQMAYVKEWATRSFGPLELRLPTLLAGEGRAVRADACAVVDKLGPFDLAYLDPPYNQHRYDANYHVWETLVAWDAPDHYGVACKRTELRDPNTRSRFNRRREMSGALADVVVAVPARVVVVSYNNEAWVTLDELIAMCERRGHVEVLAFNSKRYVGAQIGIFNPNGRKVGKVSHLRNLEYVLVAGERAEVHRIAAGVRRSPESAAAGLCG